MVDEKIQKRNRANKRRGADFETDLVNEFRQRGLVADRLHLSGKDDEGDIYVRSQLGDLEFIVEAKNVQTLDLAGFVKELRAERENYAKHRDWLAPIDGYVIIKRRGKPVEESYVVTTVKDFF